MSISSTEAPDRVAQLLKGLWLPRFPFVASTCHADAMRVTEAHVAGIPPGNLRVSSAEFVELWIAAEGLCDEQTRRTIEDWSAAAVAITCEWLAGAVVPSFDGRLVPATAPVALHPTGPHGIRSSSRLARNHL